MAEKVNVGGVQYDAAAALLLLSLDERRAVLFDMQREAARRGAAFPNDPRALAVACECWIVGRFDSSAMLSEVARRGRDGWAGVLDDRRIAVRSIYDRMHEGPDSSPPRNVHGFRRPHLETIERELAAGATPHEAACAVWRTERRLREAEASPEDLASRRARPALRLAQDRLPPDVALSRLTHPFRRYEPLVVRDSYAYPVSDSWMVLPREPVRSFANGVAAWFAGHWPEGLEFCDDPEDRIPGYDMDRTNVGLAAEAYARGLFAAEAASFIFDQRAKEADAA